MFSNISLIAGAFVAIGVEAQYGSYNSYRQPTYSAHQHRPQQYQYYQPYYQAYSYPMNTSAVPTGWYSATQEYRPIAIPYVAEKGTETIYASCKSVGGSLSLAMTQMPGQPISVTVESVGGAFVDGTARGQPIIFRLLEYGCQQFDDARILIDNPEYNPIEEKLPDGTGVAAFQDETRGRIDGIGTSVGGVNGANAANTAAILNATPVQNNFLQNLLGEKGIMGRCIYSNNWEQATQIGGVRTAANSEICNIQRAVPPTAYKNPQFTPTHHHFYPQQYNRYPSFPRYNNYSQGGIY